MGSLDDKKRLELAKARAQAADAWRSHVESKAVLHRQRASLLEQEVNDLKVVARRLQYHIDDLNRLLTERDVSLSWCQKEIIDLNQRRRFRWPRRIQAWLARFWPGRIKEPLMEPVTLLIEPAPEVPTSSPILLASGKKSVNDSLPVFLLVTAPDEKGAIPTYVQTLLPVLSEQANVFIWHMGNVSEVDQSCFELVPGYVCTPSAREDYALAREQASHICKEIGTVEAALFIGKDCKSALPALAGCGIPILSIIPDEAVYRHDIYFWQELFFWSNHTAFLSATAREQALDICSYLRPQCVSVLPGLPACVVSDKARVALKPWQQSGSKGITMAGWGPASFEGGMDVFIECARAFKKEASKDLAWHFVWFQYGGDAPGETAFLLTLRSLLLQADLSEHVSIVDAKSVPLVPQVFSMVIIPARQELPCSPAQQILAQGVPVLAFSELSSLAQALDSAGLGEACLAPAGDIAAMAQKVVTLGLNKSAWQELSDKIQQTDWQNLVWPVYIERILTLMTQVQKQHRQEYQDEAVIASSGQLDPAYMGEIVSLKDRATTSDAFLYLRAWYCGMGARKPRAGFHPGIYAEHTGVFSAFSHFLKNNSPDGPWSFPVIHPLTGSIKKPRKTRVALHIHAFYADMLVDILERLHRNTLHPDLYISVPGKAQYELADTLLQSYKGKVAVIEIVPNRGRDIGPFLSTFGRRMAENYDLIGHIHTKRSPHADRNVVDLWRNFLMENLLGGPLGGAMMDAIIYHMAKNPHWGAAFADDPLMLGWDGNQQCAALLAQYMGISDVPEQFVFPAGTMFWLRAKALQPFLDLGLSYEDYPEEPLPIDGSVLHALERLFGVVPQAMGMQTALVSVPGISR